MPEQAAKVFISYSWDSDSHRERVIRFINDLRAEDIDVTYDGDLLLGERITTFMERAVTDSDYVLLLCTPLYKQKADLRRKGVGYKNNIISSELYESSNEGKFIPLLFSGSWEESLPVWAKGKLGLDLSTSLAYRSGLQRLVCELRDSKHSEGGRGPSEKAIKTTAEMRGLDKEGMRTLLADYQQLARVGAPTGDLMSAIGYCYLHLGLFDEANAAYRQSIALAQVEPDSYYYHAISSLRGTRPFLVSMSTIQQVVGSLEKALQFSARGKYYLLLAIVQQDFFEKKRLNHSGSAAESYRQSLYYGVSPEEVDELYRLVPVEPIRM